MFVTCGSGTVKIVDRTGEKQENGGNDFAWGVSALSITIESNSQPFIADLNGDFIEDVMFNQPGQTDIMIAFQVPGDPAALLMQSFNSGLIAGDEDCLAPFDSKQLTTPHSTAMLDFDGDCMSDLFLTTKHGGENYYEFYMRRERTRSVSQPASAASNTTEPTEITGFSSFCLVSREKLSSSTNNMVGF